MKYLISLLGLTIGVWIFVSAMADWNERQAKEISDEAKSRIIQPDPLREVGGYDYGENKFIYTDEMPLRVKFDDRKQSQAYPDFYTQSIDTNTGTNNKLRYINHDGKRYRIEYRSNGVVELSLED